MYPQITQSTMKDVYYKVENNIISSQYGAAFVIGMNIDTFRSKLYKAGGIDKIDKIELNNYTIEIIKQTLTQLTK